MSFYNYKCLICGQRYIEEYDTTPPDELTCECGHFAGRCWLFDPPGLINTDTWSDTKFTPHYDEQLGTHFESKEQRDAYLKSKNLVSLEGPKSPEGHNNSRPRMSRSQAEKYDPRALTHNAVPTGRK